MGKKKSKVEPEGFVIPNEVKGLVITAGNILLLLSLLSFHDGDDRSNWLGLAGFTVAWILNYLFGLASYLMVCFFAWWGWRKLWDKSTNHVKYRLQVVLLATVASAMLLNIWTENSPRLQRIVGLHVYTRALEEADHHPANVALRHYTGGVPLYFLYKEIPRFNLHRLLNDIGVTIIFGTLLLAAIFMICKIRLEDIKSRFTIWKEKPREPDRDPRRFIPRLALPLYGRKKEDPHFEDEPLILETEQEEAEEEPSPVNPERSLSVPAPIKTRDENVVIEVAPERKNEPIRKREVVKEVLRSAALNAQRLCNGDFSRYTKPSTNLLTKAKPVDQTLLRKGLRRQAEVLEETLLSFGIEAKVGKIHCGPTITAFEVHPAVGVKVQKILALENDIALNMKAKTIRIIAPIPGKAAVGIEVPNPSPQEVSFREMFDAYRRKGHSFAIPVLLGKTVTGEHVMSDLAKMPHCIIAGATGSGKSVCINTVVMSILMNARPDEIRLLMIDPKKVELTPYSRLPHMLAPVITEPQGACAALNWLVKEMERRYEVLKQVGVRNIGAFNSRTREAHIEEALEIDIPETFYYVVCIIDELADLMMIASSDIETPIARIAQMARAVGIHLILATQRPSREVITGLIKANFPTRISFKVASRVNSQIVLDESGGESLLGNGDMLFLPPGTSTLVRAQGAYIRDEDINKVIQSICKQSPPNYIIESFDQEDVTEFLGMDSEEDSTRDSLYDQALGTVMETGNASTTFLQRKLKIGYARAASIMDQLEEAGVVTPPDGSKARRVLAPGSTNRED